MKKLFLYALVTLLVSVKAQAGEIVTDSIKSTVLNSWVKYNVYLPNGFKESSKHYPVVYLLHGLSDDYTAWRDKGHMQTVADELIESGEAREMVIVMPNAGGPDLYKHRNGYFNMPGWSYEDFFFQELLPNVEKKYRAGGDKSQRAVMGLSMGGGGSTVYALHHPELFSSVYAMSAWLDTDGGRRREEGVDDYLYLVVKSVHDDTAKHIVESADEAAVEKFRTVKWFFDCGDDDGLVYLSVDLYREMQNKRIKAELRVRNGVHNWEYWHQAIRVAFPYASRNFGK